MKKQIDQDIISSFYRRLETHPIYDSIESLEDLRCFMQHHVYSVWDFMSLIKYLQNHAAPTSYPWFPVKDTSIKRFINEIVLEEECDTTIDKTGFISHFELYQTAMKEVGADTTNVNHFLDLVKSQGINKALESDFVPKASSKFTKTTFKFIQEDKPHKVAAAMALGREHIIPSMFRAILLRTKINDKQAPIFHYYLNRHVHLDQDFHAPLSLNLLNSLCQNETMLEESLMAANDAVNARLDFWDGVLEKIKFNKKNNNI